MAGAKKGQGFNSSNPGPTPPKELLDHLFAYDPATGVLTSKVARGTRIWRGKIIDTSKSVTISKMNYSPGRIIWKMMTGVEAVGMVDHADLNHSNNIWSNLREASSSDNAKNRLRSVASKSGHRNITVRRGKYTVRIYSCNTCYHKSHSSLEEAILDRDLQLVAMHGDYLPKVLQCRA